MLMSTEKKDALEITHTATAEGWKPVVQLSP